MIYPQAVTTTKNHVEVFEGDVLYGSCPGARLVGVVYNERYEEKNYINCQNITNLKSLEAAHPMDSVPVTNQSYSEPFYTETYETIEKPELTCESMGKRVDGNNKPLKTRYTIEYPSRRYCDPGDPVRPAHKVTSDNTTKMELYPA